VNRSYGVWIFHARSPIDDKRVVRENRRGYWTQTLFQRAVGIRYLGYSESRFPDSWGGFTGSGPRAKPRTLTEMLGSYFSKGPLKRHRVTLRPRAHKALSGYNGHAILAAKHLRRVGVPGIAVFVANVRVRIENDAEPFHRGDPQKATPFAVPSCQTLDGTSQSNSIDTWSATVNDPEKQVLRALDTYKSAVLAKSAETFMHLYDPEVRVFDTWGMWSYEGAVAWRIAVEGWFSSLGTETVRVTFEDVKITAEPSFALMSAFARYAAYSAQGQELRAMQNRISWVLKSRGHVLRVIHEHTSAPIGFEDTKAILKREGKS
jgi:ketosteroid isomerase-like protein